MRIQFVFIVSVAYFELVIPKKKTIAPVLNWLLRNRRCPTTPESSVLMRGKMTLNSRRTGATSDKLIIISNHCMVTCNCFIERYRQVDIQLSEQAVN